MAIFSLSFQANQIRFGQVSFSFWKVVINHYHISFTLAEECKQVVSSVGRNATRFSFSLYVKGCLFFISLSALICIIHLNWQLSSM